MDMQLYFLRSSESKIVLDMLPFAYSLDELKKSVEDVSELKRYSDFYGLTPKDLGLYALVDNTIAGAIWSRELEGSVPELSMAVLPAFRGRGIGSAMMQQFLQEAGVQYNTLCVYLAKESNAVRFYKKYGFKIQESSQRKSYVDDSQVIKMTKELEKKELIRPSDGYDASYWMD
ncbi:MAG: GNAT family N-acetyltransferase [Sulfurimonas sp.]